MWIDIALGYVAGELMLGGVAVLCVLALLVLCYFGDKRER